MSHKVWSDTEKNRLYIQVTDLELERADELKEEIIAELSNLKKGFTCVCDLLNSVPKHMIKVELMPPDVVATYISFIKYLYECGMGKMLRVLDPQLYLVAKIVEEECREGFTMETVSSMEEADMLPEMR